MKEVKTPKRPLIFYYLIALAVLLLFQMLVMPMISQGQIIEVDYTTFVNMVEDGEVSAVEIQEADNRILFTNTDRTAIYKTAMVPDPALTERLLAADIPTAGQEIEQTSFLVSLLSWIIPIVIFIAIGQYMSRKLMQRAGGSNALSFGSSNAKVYVKSSEGIRFADVAGEDEAKENLAEIVDYLHNPQKYREIGASMPKGILLVGPPGTGKT
ncbi:MAG TPA: ATP-dependent metallopeptidase FtsH/Yme1/Tma family protein, partial [Candidatus Onthomonas avicola]|nr:ATP-dependent metallopeptidase FtsH/Yme1/Tma family protein [Candidatus Onthomonas avicola]